MTTPIDNYKNYPMGLFLVSTLHYLLGTLSSLNPVVVLFDSLAQRPVMFQLGMVAQANNHSYA